MRRPRPRRLQVTPAENGQADQLVEVEPKDCSEAALFALREGGCNPLDFEQVYSPSTRAGPSCAHMVDLADTLQPAPK